MNIQNVFAAIRQVEEQIQQSLIDKASTELFNLVLLNEDFIQFNPSLFDLVTYIHGTKLRTKIYILEKHSKVIIGQLLLVEQNKLRVIYQSCKVPTSKTSTEENLNAQNLLIDFITSNKFDGDNKSSHLITQLSEDVRTIEINPMSITTTRARFYIAKSTLVIRVLVINFFSSFWFFVSGCNSGDVIFAYITYFFLSGVFGFAALPNIGILLFFWGGAIGTMTISALVCGIFDTVKEHQNRTGLFNTKSKYFIAGK
jgi:hypothetical protein